MLGRLIRHCNQAMRQVSEHDAELPILSMPLMLQHSYVPPVQLQTL